MKCKACKHYTRVGEMCEGILDIIEPGEVECWGYERAINADRIRAMSDEELVAFMMADLPCDALYGQMCTIYHGNCEGCVRDWLRQPAEKA